MTIEEDLAAFERGETPVFKRSVHDTEDMEEKDTLETDDLPEPARLVVTKHDPGDSAASLRESGVRFYGTKRLVSGTRGTIILYVEHSWGFNTKDVVELSMRNLTDPKKMEITTIKKMSHLGNSTALFINKEWGYLAGEWVRFSIKLKGNMGE